MTVQEPVPPRPEERPGDPLRVLVYSVVNRHDAGGAQNVINRLLRNLRARGHAVMEAWAGPERRSTAEAWICPLYLRTGPGRSYHMPSLWRAAVGLAVRRPQVVNVHIVTSQAKYFLLLACLFGYKTVISAHGSDILKPDPGCSPHLGAVLRAADAVTVVSGNLRDKVLAYPGVDAAKVHVISNGIDCAFWSPEKPAEPRPPTIVALGRLEHVKGFDVLLAAFASVRAAVPAARLCIIGDGSLAGDLRRQAEDLGVAEAVYFPGHLDAHAIRERLRGASVFALSSRSEGMPLSLLEAMACGLPAVATTVGGVPEVVSPDAGALVAPEDANALAEALTSILKDDALRQNLARGAHARAQLYSDTASYDAYERVYRQVLGA